jgi:hypothetical protein
VPAKIVVDVKPKAPARAKKPVALVPAVPEPTAPPRARVTTPAAARTAAKTAAKTPVRRGTRQPAPAAEAPTAASILPKPRPSRAPRVSVKKALPPAGPVAKSAGLWPFPTGDRP